MRQFAAVGADLHYGGTLTGAALRTLVALTRHPGTQLIPMGGSSPLGVLGFIDAGLELADQIEQGALPEPERLYVALGTGGTAAGLAVGLALAGLRTRVVGVLVTDRGTLQPNRRLVEWLARRAARLLARAGAEPGRLELRLEIETGFRGAGYGHPTPACVEAVERAAQEEGLRLETTYTGKALAALIARESGGVDPVLFWNTYAGVDPELELPDWSALPRPFHRFFEAST
jgi:D-cysteine desulfhydrase